MVTVYSPGIDLIVVNYRTANDLRHFLGSYEKHLPTLPHTLVIGNVDPLDEDREVAEESGKTFCEWDHNIGYATAVNYVSRFGDREVIGIFNADTRLTENVVLDCHNALVSNPSWGVVGPRQIDDTHRITHGGIFGTNAHRQERGFHHRNSDAYSDIREDAITVAGSAYFIKRAVWDELLYCRIFSETYPEAEGAFLPTAHYYEETFCSFHAREHGHKVVYYGPAVMIHQWHRASPVGGPADRQLGVSREMFRQACDAHGISHE